jgi:hypothetical protein
LFLFENSHLLGSSASCSYLRNESIVFPSLLLYIPPSLPRTPRDGTSVSVSHSCNKGIKANESSHACCMLASSYFTSVNTFVVCNSSSKMNATFRAIPFDFCFSKFGTSNSAKFLSLFVYILF